MWGQLSSLTATLVEKANELVDEVGQDAAAAAQQLVRGEPHAADAASALGGAGHGATAAAAAAAPFAAVPVAQLTATQPPAFRPAAV